jgi:hypothetical protein
LEAASTRTETPAAVAPKVGRPPLFVLLGALLLYFLRLGYDYGASDQDEILPYLFHRMDPSLFTQDWFVQTQVSGFSVRTYFVWLLHAFALFLPVWLATLVLYVLTWLLIAGAVYVLARHFTGDRLAAAATVVLALVMTPLWTLGGNELAHTMLVPSMLAWALALWAIYQFLHGRFILAPVLLGVACWMQALVGLQVAGLLILFRLVNIVRKERGPFTFGSFAMFAGLFVLWSSPSLGPILYQQFSARPVETGELPSLFYILARFRLPHHYLFFSFYTHSLVRFGLLAVLGAAVLALPRVRPRLHDGAFVLRTLGVVAVLCVFAFVFTEVAPVLFVAKLQLFKTTVLAKLLLLIVLAGAFFQALPAAARRPLEAVMDRGRWALAAVLVAWALLVAAVTGTDGGYLHDQVRPWVRAETDFGRVEAWVRTNTSRDAVFAVPPSDDTFRSTTQRTIVVNHKAIPYEDEHLLTWFERLTDLAPIPLPERGAQEVEAALDSAFNHLPADALQRLSQTYRFHYVVRAAPLVGTGTFRERFRSGPWYVYEVVPETAPEAPPGTAPEAAPEAARGTDPDA